MTLDGNMGPDEAWRHRQVSLTFEAAHGIYDLSHPTGDPDPTEPTSWDISRHHDVYERSLPDVRPAATTVERTRRLERLLPGAALLRPTHPRCSS